MRRVEEKMVAIIGTNHPCHLAKQYNDFDTLARGHRVFPFSLSAK